MPSKIEIQEQIATLEAERQAFLTVQAEKEARARAESQFLVGNAKSQQALEQLKHQIDYGELLAAHSQYLATCQQAADDLIEAGENLAQYADKIGFAEKRQNLINLLGEYQTRARAIEKKSRNSFGADWQSHYDADVKPPQTYQAVWMEFLRKSPSVIKSRLFTLFFEGVTR